VFTARKEGEEKKVKKKKAKALPSCTRKKLLGRKLVKEESAVQSLC